MARTPTNKTANNPTNLTANDPVIKKPVDDNQNHHRTLKYLFIVVSNKFRKETIDI